MGYPGQLGDSIHQRTRWSTGFIVESDATTQTYVVKTSRYPHAVLGVPRIARDPGEVTMLDVGTEVVLHEELGFLAIDGVIKRPSLIGRDDVPLNAALSPGIGDDETSLSGTTTPSYRTEGDPRDILPGDWLRRSKQGNHIAVMSGGVNGVVSSPMAAVYTANQPIDGVYINSYEYRHMTAMGELSVTTDEDGKSSLTWYAGSDGRAESRDGNWTLRLEAGAVGDLFNLRVTTPDGNTLAQFHINAAGRVSIYGVAGVDVRSGGDGTALEQTEGAKVIEVAKDYTLTSGGAVTFEGTSFQLTSLGGGKIGVSGNRVDTVGGDFKGFTIGNYKQTIQGGATATPGSVAHKLEVINGTSETVIAQTTKTTSVGQNYNVIQYGVGGSINFVVQPTALGGKFNVVTTEPNSVCLGANGLATPNPATDGHDVTAVSTSGVMKYEAFSAMMELLMTWLDGHTHLSTAVGAPTSPAALSAPAPLPPLPLPGSVRVFVAAAIPPIRSVRVCVGL